MIRHWVRVAVPLMIVLAWALVVPQIAEAQKPAGTITGSGSRWDDMALYESGGKLFVDDVTGARVLVYDARTLAYITEISFAAYSPRYPMMLAIHQGTGTLYVALGTGSATNDTIIVPVNANTYATGTNLTNNGWDLFMVIDEARARLYLVGSKGLGDVLTAVDINTNTVAGTLNLYTLMGSGLMSFGREALNQVTGELVFANIHYDKFLIVNGPALTGQLITATSSRGRAPAWNPAEHKLYITTVAWNGYFIYHPDTASSSVTPCINDGTKIFYSQASNRMYTSAELEGWPLGTTTLIDGATNSCQNVTLPVGGLTGVGFVNARRHAYFAGTIGTFVLDENTLTVVMAFPGSGGYGAVDTQVVVDQTHGRVFVRNSWSSPSQDSSIDVIDDRSGASLDVDGDGTTDITVYRAGTGTWYSLPSGSPGTYTSTQWGMASDIPVPGDYDGDGKMDVAAWRPSEGVWYVRPSGSPENIQAVQWGMATDIPLPADYDGDGRADGAVWRPSTGVWYILKSSDDYNPATYVEYQWGIQALGDIPVPGDYDGDGKADLAVYRPSEGMWYILKSSDNYSYATYLAYQWGDQAAGDIPVPGDYDGDGRTDLAVWRASTGTWYILKSIDDYNPGTYVECQWGDQASGDIPVPGDYDGDGMTDIAVWRPGTGTWYILKSSDNYSYATYVAYEWGAGTDVPLSSATTILRLIGG